MDRQPRIPQGGTAGTGYMLAASGRGLRWTEKTCPDCGRNFRVKPQASLHVFKAQFDGQGVETPAYWYASTRETRLNGAHEYASPRKMTKAQAEHFFTVELGIILAPKAPQGGLTAQEARAYYAHAAQAVELRVFRKEMAPAISTCRKCYAKAQKHLANVLASETIIIRHKKGRRVVDVQTLMPNAKPKEATAKPKKKRTKKASEMPQIWFCTTPSHRLEPSRTVKTPEPMLLHDAKAWFRFHLSRLTLSGCSITG